MDLIGGGAKNPDEFLQYMGNKRPFLGSPFQIDFPHLSPSSTPVRHDQSSVASDDVSSVPPVPMNASVRSCADGALDSRCACIDCPDVCTALPEVPPPNHHERCKLFGWECLQLSLLTLYIFAVVAFVLGYQWKRVKVQWGKRTRYAERDSHLSTSSDSAFEHVRLDGDDSGSSAPSEVPASTDEGLSPGLMRFAGEGNLNALRATQPRSYKINRWLSDKMYLLGLTCAKKPWATFALASALLGIANLGWIDFKVETDPVRLWVAPNSAAKRQKDFFDEHFGPFYRTQQIFVTDQEAEGFYRLSDPLSHDNAVDDLPPVLDWDRLQWWADVEAEIRSIQSGPNYTRFQDICFAPTGDACVVQSIMGYFGDDLVGAGVTETNWRERLTACTQRPAECLPAFGQPLKSNVVLGGVPNDAPTTEARALVGTWVVENSLNATVLERAEEWEKDLERFLLELSGKVVHEDGNRSQLAVRAEELGLHLTFSTGVSLQEEIASSSNTDTTIVALSYLLMLLYGALTLGGPAPSKSKSFTSSTGNLPPGRHVRTGFARDLRTVFAHIGSRQGGIRLPEEDDEALEYDSRRQARKMVQARLVYRLFVRSKFMLGLFGILIVLVAISSAVGIWSVLGIRVTLVIAEVIPFLVLAVGVDNIFLLSDEMDRQSTLSSTGNPYYGVDSAETGSNWQGDYDDEDDDHFSLQDQGALDLDVDVSDYAAATSGNGNRTAFHLSAEQRAARALGRMGPSIVLSTSIQISAFLLGSLVPMPAVRNFTLYAAGSMFIAVLLHCTVFVAALALDAQRTEAGRVDCVPCVRAFPQQQERIDSLSISANRGLVRESKLAVFMREKYAPLIVRKNVKRMILAAFILLGGVSVNYASKIQMGLDQRLALPPDSYLRGYFDATDTWLDVGPPVYFVEWRGDVKYKLVQRQMCARFTTCAPFSVANTLEGERKRPESSFLIEPAASWIDDFFQWLNPLLEGCCRVRKSDPSSFCSTRDSDMACRPCFEGREYNITLAGLPEGEEFMMFLRQWLKSPSTAECPLGGQAAYSSAISLMRSNLTYKDPLLDVKKRELSRLGEWQGPVPSREDRKMNIYASHFRTSHVPLRSQTDFIDALQAAHRIAEETSLKSGVRLFPYSMFYVFFDQYLHLTKLTVQVLSLAACAIFGISFILLGCWRTALVIVVCVASTLTGVGGTMGYAGIQLNALTLVNLSVCAAIGVEFCAHVARAFMRAPGGLARNHPLAQRERDGRALAALGDVGASVLSGITGTKLVGISVLWFTKSELLRLYYAKMWMALIILGALHGLVLLPVLLSFYGGRGYAGVEDESEVRRRLLRAQEGNEYRPFTDDEDDSDDEA